MSKRSRSSVELNLSATLILGSESSGTSGSVWTLQNKLQYCSGVSKVLKSFSVGGEIVENMMLLGGYASDRPQACEQLAPRVMLCRPSV